MGRERGSNGFGPLRDVGAECCIGRRGQLMTVNIRRGGHLRFALAGFNLCADYLAHLCANNSTLRTSCRLQE